MSRLISSSCDTPVIMLRMFFWLVIVALAIAAHAAQSAENSNITAPSKRVIHPVSSMADWLPPYQLDADIAPSCADGMTLDELCTTTQISPTTERMAESVWPTKVSWQTTADLNRISSSSLQRSKEKGERLDIKTQRPSVLFEWRKALR